MAWIMTSTWRRISWTLRLFVLFHVLQLHLSSSVPAVDDPVVSYSGHKVIRLHPATPRQMEMIRRLEEEFHYGIDVWGESADVNSSTASIDIHVAPQIYDEVTHLLRQSGVRFSIKIDDLQRAIDRQKSDSELHRAKHRRRRSTAASAASSAAANDSDVAELDDIVGTYARYADINDWLWQLRERFSEIVQLIEIGKSFEGRPLTVIKIGKQSTTATKKPAVWIDARIHAREWIAPATAVYIIHALLSRNGNDDNVTSLLTSYDWYILPVLNPDGYEYSHNKDRMWRKTRSRRSRNRCVGVDGNRNFDFQWRNECVAGAGRSASRCRGQRPCDSVYAGPVALSELETIALANFILEHKSTIKLYVALHSYSQLWLTPWGYTLDQPQDIEDLMRVARKAVAALNATYGTEYETGSPAVLLYPATGGAYDWAKGFAGIKYSYTLELRDKGLSGFLLPPAQIVPTGEETLGGLLAAVGEIDKDRCWVYGVDCTVAGDDQTTARNRRPHRRRYHRVQ